MSETDYKEMLFDRAAKMIKVNGIISIVAGGLASLIVIIYSILIAVVSLTADSTVATSPDAGGNALLGLILFVLVFAPCVYMVIAGIILVRLPKPTVARGLLIANLVLGVFVNTIGLIFAIISLTQIHDYEVGYKHSR